MDILGAHPTCIQRDHLLFDAGYTPLIFGEQLWFKLFITVSGNVD